VCLGIRVYGLGLLVGVVGCWLFWGFECMGEREERGKGVREME